MNTLETLKSQLLETYKKNPINREKINEIRKKINIIEEENFKKEFKIKLDRYNEEQADKRKIFDLVYHCNLHEKNHRDICKQDNTLNKTKIKGINKLENLLNHNLTFFCVSTYKYFPNVSNKIYKFIYKGELFFITDPSNDNQPFETIDQAYLYNDIETKPLSFKKEYINYKKIKEEQKKFEELKNKHEKKLKDLNFYKLKNIVKF